MPRHAGVEQLRDRRGSTPCWGIGVGELAQNDPIEHGRALVVHSKADGQPVLRVEHLADELDVAVKRTKRDRDVTKQGFEIVRVIARTAQTYVDDHPPEGLV